MQSSSRFSIRSHATVLTEDELDDDALITILEENPTFNRDPKIVMRARSKVASLTETGSTVSTTTTAQPTPTPAQPTKKTGGRISFV